MTVFTDDWVQKIRARYERLPMPQRPAIYKFVTSDRWTELRQVIEQYIDELPIDTQNKIIKTVHGHTKEFEGLIHLFGDLAIGHTLIQLGYEIEYEKLIGTQTPDWYVKPRQDSQPFIVEVFTKELSTEANLGWRNLNELFSWLQQIKVDCRLYIVANKDFTLTNEQIKPIFRKVQTWLTATQLEVGKVLSVDGLTITIFQTGTGRARVLLGFEEQNVFFVDTEPLKDAISKKVSKYKNLDCPIVVAVIANALTGFGVEDLSDAATRSELISSADLPVFPLDDEIGNGVPRLSAVLWVENVYEERKIYVLPNPHSTNPLPLNTWQNR